MNARTQMKPVPVLERDITPQGSDYEIVRQVIEKISLDYRDQPSLEELAADVGETPTGLQKLFTRWAGLSPKGFLQAVTLDHARRLLEFGRAAAGSLHGSGHVRPRPPARFVRHP